MTKREVDTSWIHNAAGFACQLSAQEAHRNVAIDDTTIVGTLPHQEDEEPTYIVHIQGTETERRHEYSWPIEEYWSVTRKPDGTPVVDEATDERITQVSHAGKP